MTERIYGDEDLAAIRRQCYEAGRLGKEAYTVRGGGEAVVRCRDCKFCDVVPDGSTCFCRQFYDKPDWGLPAPYTGSEPAEMLEVSFDGFCAWGERKGDS